MRTETTTRTLYTYNELAPEAQEKARNWYREASAEDDYSEHVIENFADLCDMLGLDIRQTRKARMNGETFYAPVVYWSGFNSQGDGACFDGAWRADILKPGKVAEEYPNDDELQRIACVFERGAEAYPGARFTVVHRRHYYHPGCTSFDFDMNPPEDHDDIARSATEWAAIRSRDALTEEELRDAARDLMGWLYKALEEEYNYQNSDEVVAETIIANEYEFTESGRAA